MTERRLPSTLDPFTSSSSAWPTDEQTRPHGTWPPVWRHGTLQHANGPITTVPLFHPLPLSPSPPSPSPPSGLTDSSLDRRLPWPLFFSPSPLTNLRVLVSCEVRSARTPTAACFPAFVRGAELTTTNQSRTCSPRAQIRPRPVVRLAPVLLLRLGRPSRDPGARTHARLRRLHSVNRLWKKTKAQSSSSQQHPWPGPRPHQRCRMALALLGPLPGPRRRRRRARVTDRLGCMPCRLQSPGSSQLAGRRSTKGAIP